jgi:hypothetical protein
MKFENTQVFNFEGAFRGLRNPLESWNKSDSQFCLTDIYMDDTLTEVCDAWIKHENVGRRKRGLEELSHDMQGYQEYYEVLEKYENWLLNEGLLRQSDYGANVYDVAFLGPNDLGLAQKLILAGPEHCKFMRQIFVSVDVTAPLYWWKEFDTYKVGTTANSTSTMHKLTSKPITKDCFEYDDALSPVIEMTQNQAINLCENLRQLYIETKDKAYWRALVQLLPQGWLQTRTVTMSYANLRNIYFQRRDHKLEEWNKFCNWISKLPYGGELIMLEEKGE